MLSSKHVRLEPKAIIFSSINFISEDARMVPTVRRHSEVADFFPWKDKPIFFVAV